ncbi:MAG: DNA cytosine methyltransferase [Brevundimonas sp.]|uniref:DNA cytosine methyltransferase n=1 Tax=Brevundimonas sp. TaxID=1871086 RepID=UPI002728223E|nr:DNA cytosine methyltransferase [Brevundimonas sp.]MDO9076870.1 DNA cytosine methyltransferase [Brevundimonas sp.]MDZ4060626.1 DNA cytosine methyltransferase [Brevundimonas sp.]
MAESTVREPAPGGYYEFFAGGGMVRAGLGAAWHCLFANDFDPAKAAAYRANWGDADLKVGDIATLSAADLPGEAALMWGSFPCQDLSLAGVGAGLGGKRSGTFHDFWGLARALADEGRAPRVVAVENVCGALTSHGGRDFEVICRTFADAGYRCGALVINADRFVPQSRPRLFVIGVRDDAGLDPALTTGSAGGPFHTPALRRAVERLPVELQGRMVWWRLPEPGLSNATLGSVIEPEPSGVRWHSAAETQRLLALMSVTNLAKVEAARRTGERCVGGLYRRTRRDASGARIQRAEVRFDVAGCLRTPGGGSSRQTLLVVEDGQVRSRLMSARETARLMGLPDSYRLPGSYSAACHLTGDGVAVPVVRHLAQWLIEPLAGAPAGLRRAA